MDGLTADQQELLASIMGKSSQQSNFNNNFNNPVANVNIEPHPVQNDNSNRVLSQAEIDALIASLG